MVRFYSLALISFFMLMATAQGVENNLSLSLQQEQYAGDPEIDTQSSQYTQIGLSERFLWSQKKHLTIFEAKAILPMSESASFGLAIPELFYSYGSILSPVEVTVGRRKKVWSELDANLNLGLWQPQVRWDAVSPIQQGLTGLFFETGTSQVRLTLFASAVFLPDQQPDFDVVDGKIVSSSRWFRAPVSHAELNYGTSNIYYDVIKPEAAEVVNNDSYAMMLHFGAENRGPFARLSAARKPMNQFHLGIDAREIYQLTSGDLSPKVHPVVVKHTLYTLESGVKNDGRLAMLSLNWEKFKNPNLPEGWEQTSLIDAAYMGGYLRQNLGLMNLPQTILTTSYVARKETEETEKSTVIRGEVTASTQRLAFEELVSVGFEHVFLRRAKRQVDAGISYNYSITDGGEWITANLNIGIETNWQVNVRADVFGVEDEAGPEKSFMSLYRANDRLIGGLSYVF